ncbi:hypothetical protein CBW54_08505 [Yersinia kristensenii]|nr:hypothetical protein CBW54_08505 [Yersinia kristensenii]
MLIRVQYFATLLSRPHAGRYADLLGPKKVVLFGWSCCGVSGIFCGLWRVDYSEIVTLSQQRGGFPYLLR